MRTGCAGWSLGREYWPEFPAEGTHLQRYSSRFDAVEINSSFYRPHRPQTYRHWAQSVPAGFRFSVKIPKSITHEQRLQDCEVLLDMFLAQCCELGEKLGCLLIQLPPSLDYVPGVATRFFTALRSRYSGTLVIEPRHESWHQAEALMIEQRIARVAADPSPVSMGQLPGGWPGARYWRLHGSPTIYHSTYGADRLEPLARQMLTSAEAGVETWCIFDNTASGAAIGDALLLNAINH
ncbi:hypothetical protein ALQ48_00223 [Pseudomonas coronafaciens pv. zizaniae]|uniref:DUF72 domain-containing protein n=1 Tax=Pseudomonas syringae group TaxID=136849 RepID=UPI0006D5E46F|nr:MULTISPECIES: DUF72 domain-containing protein [Pseudomonas syringae group]RMN90940.1 hypothetical protein ALQ50_04343 [Pseudomonas coronafaciens pv. coronafaciens]RMO08129.1 hypothetical protein ALQ48_00223 [Pseudomonas coronafaciens pv. zizaniae]